MIEGNKSVEIKLDLIKDIEYGHNIRKRRNDVKSREYIRRTLKAIINIYISVVSDSHDRQGGRVVMRDQVRILEEQVLCACN